MQQGDTISAIVTPPGEGGVGIVRLSGEEAFAIADVIFCAKSGKKIGDIRSSSFSYGYILDEKGKIIDEALMLVMRTPNSYTREDIVELQCHGGAVVLRSVLERTFSLGARPAQRGEFTKRAFLNGRIDLSEAQAVMEIVGAKTKASLRMASGRLSGKFSGKITELRHKILDMIAHLEATIDFPEDEIDEVVLDDVHLRVVIIKENIDTLLKTSHAGRILKDGLQTAIIGKPNVGKSSLLNALLFEERAIVTDIPGTTRDSIEAFVNVGGVPLVLTDTAGIREAKDEVEKIGIERARSCAEKAALVLIVFDGSAPMTNEDEDILRIAKERDAVFLINKSDQPQKYEESYEKAIRASLPEAEVLQISAKTGEGIEELSRWIEKKAYGGELKGDEASFVNDAREVDILRRASEYLGNALQTIKNGMSADFVSIDLRSAWETLGEITGETVGEDIIDEIFSKFCLGK